MGTAAPATLLKERVGGGGVVGRLEERMEKHRKREGESPGPNKAMGARTGLGPPLL